MRTPLHSWAVTTTALVAMALGLRAADPANFKPDGSFKGSTLTGWHIVGGADWSAQNGELIGRAKPGTSGGWLVMDKSFQDLQLYTSVKCTGECKSGVLLRAQKTADGGMTGVYVSLSNGDTNAYAVAIDQTGRKRRATSWSRRRRAVAAHPPLPARPHAARRPLRHPLAARRSAAQADPDRRIKAGDWNETYITIATDGPPAASQLGPVRLVSTFTGTLPVDEKNAAAFGPIALYVGGTGEVRYKDLAWKDLDARGRTARRVVRPVRDSAPDDRLLRMGCNHRRRQPRRQS